MQLSESTRGAASHLDVDLEQGAPSSLTEGRAVVLSEAEFERLLRLSLDLTSGLHTATSERLQLNRETRTALVQSLKHAAIALSAGLRRQEPQRLREVGSTTKAE